MRQRLAPSVYHLSAAAPASTLVELQWTDLRLILLCRPAVRAALRETDVEVGYRIA